MSSFYIPTKPATTTGGTAPSSAIATLTTSVGIALASINTEITRATLADNANLAVDALQTATLETLGTRMTTAVDAITSEVTRATAAETDLKTVNVAQSLAITTEQTRALAAETGLNLAITAEQNRAITAILAEKTRAIAAETLLDGRVTSATASATTGATAYTDSVVLIEKTRAIAAETLLDGRVTSATTGAVAYTDSSVLVEKNRAIAAATSAVSASTAYSDSVVLVEKNRALGAATSAMAYTDSSVATEVTRATGVEGTLATKITTVSARVATAETNIATNTSALSGMLGFISTNNIESSGPTLTLGGSSTTQTINIGTSNATQVMNIGTGTTAKTINIGSSADTIVIAGATVSTNTTNLAIADNQIVLNRGGLAGSGGNSGIQIEEAGVITGFITQNTARDGYDLKPSNAPLIGLNQSLLKTDNPTFGTVNANLNAVTATATTVNATVVNATNMTASGVISTATLNTTDITATGNLNVKNITAIGNISSNSMIASSIKGTQSIVSPFTTTTLMAGYPSTLSLRGNQATDNVVVQSPFVAQSSVTVGTNLLVPNGVVNMYNSVVRSKVVALWDEGTLTDSSQHNFSGFGMGGGMLRYQTGNLGTAHRFFAAIDSQTSKQLLSINPDGTLDVLGQVRAPSVLSTTGSLDLAMTGDISGGCQLSVQNRSGYRNGMTLMQLNPAIDLCCVAMTSNASSRNGKVAAMVSENRVGAMFKDSSAYGGEIDLYTDGVANTRVAAFGINGSAINSDLFVNGRLQLNGPTTTNEQQGVYTNSPANSARAPPSLAQKFIKINHGGGVYCLALYNVLDI